MVEIKSVVVSYSIDVTVVVMYSYTELVIVVGTITVRVGEPRPWRLFLGIGRVPV